LEKGIDEIIIMIILNNKLKYIITWIASPLETIDFG
jgi:hypothetical protein